MLYTLLIFHLKMNYYIFMWKLSGKVVTPKCYVLKISQAKNTVSLCSQ